MYGFVHSSDNGIDIVPVYVKFEKMFTSINSTHLIADHISLRWKRVVEKTVSSTLAIPLLFLNVHQGQLMLSL